MPAANWLQLGKVEFATTDHEPRRRTSLDKRYYGFEGYARGRFAMPGFLGQKRTAEESDPQLGAFLSDRHRCPKGGPSRFGDAVEITCVGLWAPLNPARLQKVSKQPVTDRDQLEKRHPIA
jgi:hypothetical protein